MDRKETRIFQMSAKPDPMFLPVVGEERGDTQGKRHEIWKDSQEKALLRD